MSALADVLAVAVADPAASMTPTHASQSSPEPPL